MADIDDDSNNDYTVTIDDETKETIVDIGSGLQDAAHDAGSLPPDACQPRLGDRLRSRQAE